ncbi:indole-3-glycerol phosphate synthase [Candidatus Epulonipiscium fishelsonii]|uniref:Indole-3-glycerol phosphate synthase n=1 Tax=Candidatus Epulonipiscium fishelsonii TaxID=77094 RepID=A0ACC8XI38_9FIRM|nr:indole-3-glycerol phosphate synthase [Epulopiscium sp. SCG-D08WGA-EpuloA1]OON91132.1 MAG: indole-3-glycerol phosphate synthase [Epulopiscium sp. AS2M-Bin002]
MILGKIVEATRKRLEKDKLIIPPHKMENLANSIYVKKNFKESISKTGINFICEVKKASPSKGIIAHDFDYKKIALEYEAAGADAMSVLTEPDFFMGSEKYLEEINKLVSIPTLKKDFIVDKYQIYQAKVSGASCILLICAILDDYWLNELYQCAKLIGLDVLVETHDELEIKRALNIGADIIGVNNRNLNNFVVDINTCIELRDRVPKDTVYVAESGIRNREDIKKLMTASVNAVLIGETLMREENKVEGLAKLRGCASE